MLFVNSQSVHVNPSRRTQIDGDSVIFTLNDENQRKAPFEDQLRMDEVRASGRANASLVLLSLASLRLSPLSRLRLLPGPISTYY